MNKLDEMIQKQTDLENEIYEKAFGLSLTDLTNLDKCQFIKDAAYFVTEELHEMTRELPFMKHWKSYADVDADKYAEMVTKAKKEYIDAVHFMLNIAVLFGMNAEEMHELYMGKNKVNLERQENNY